MYLVSLARLNDARVFADFMQTKGIVIRIEPKDEHIDLFLDDESQIDIVKNELTRYINNPNDKIYHSASWEIGEDSLNKTYYISKNKQLLSLKKVGPFTTLIAIISIILFIVLNLTSSSFLLHYLGFPIDKTESMEIWRWLTPIVLHFSLLHIVFNLSWWWYLGGMIEAKLGTKKLLEITLVAGVLSNYCEAVMSSPYFGGLSGVVYALMAYTWCIGEYRPNRGIYFERSMMAIAVIWLIAGYTGYLGPIANTAHLAGLIVGFGLAIKDLLFNIKK